MENNMENNKEKFEEYLDNLSHNDLKAYVKSLKRQIEEKKVNNLEGDYVDSELKNFDNLEFVDEPEFYDYRDFMPKNLDEVIESKIPFDLSGFQTLGTDTTYQVNIGGVLGFMDLKLNENKCFVDFLSKLNKITEPSIYGIKRELLSDLVYGFLVGFGINLEQIIDWIIKNSKTDKYLIQAYLYDKQSEENLSPIHIEQILVDDSELEEIMRDLNSIIFKMDIDKEHIFKVFEKYYIKGSTCFLNISMDSTKIKFVM